jgi:hypothetical protein
MPCSVFLPALGSRGVGALIFTDSRESKSERVILWISGDSRRLAFRFSGQFCSAQGASSSSSPGQRPEVQAPYNPKAPTGRQFARGTEQERRITGPSALASVLVGTPRGVAPGYANCWPLGPTDRFNFRNQSETPVAKCVSNSRGSAGAEPFWRPFANEIASRRGGDWTSRC